METHAHGLDIQVTAPCIQFHAGCSRHTKSGNRLPPLCYLAAVLFWKRTVEKWDRKDRSMVWKGQGSKGFARPYSRCLRLDSAAASCSVHGRQDAHRIGGAVPRRHVFAESCPRGSATRSPERATGLAIDRAGAWLSTGAARPAGPGHENAFPSVGGGAPFRRSGSGRGRGDG